MTVLHIGSSTRRLLLGAELMEMKKPYRDGSLREISLADIEFFQGAGDIFTMSKQTCVAANLHIYSDSCSNKQEYNTCD